jgi:hypothetical protein
MVSKIVFSVRLLQYEQTYYSLVVSVSTYFNARKHVRSRVGTCRLRSHMAVGCTITFNEPHSHPNPSASLQYNTCMETPAVSANKPRVFQHISYICTPRPTTAPIIQTNHGCMKDCHAKARSKTPVRPAGNLACVHLYKQYM